VACRRPASTPRRRRSPRRSERLRTGRSKLALVWDALRLDALGERFDTVLDSGLFHVFDDESRATYVEALGAVLEPGGRYFLCCFSDREPGDWGPRRISEDEVRVAFQRGWDVESIQAVQFITNRNPAPAEAWLATVTRR